MVDIDVIGKVVDKADNYSVAQAEADKSEISDNIVEVDYSLPGTCGDERHGKFLLSGEPITEVRPKVFGGPLVFGYITAEYANWYQTNHGTKVERFGRTARIQEEGGVEGGGHVDEKAVAEGLKTKTGCLADDKPDVYTHAIAEDPDGALAFVKIYLGNDYDEEIAAEVLQTIIALDESNYFGDWDPLIPINYLGERAQHNIEILIGEHLGKLANVNMIKGTTLNRDAMKHDAFDQDTAYADYVQKPLATGDDPECMLRKLKHAGAFMVHGIIRSIPNQEIVATRTFSPQFSTVV